MPLRKFGSLDWVCPHSEGHRDPIARWRLDQTSLFENPVGGCGLALADLHCQFAAKHGMDNAKNLGLRSFADLFNHRVCAMCSIAVT